MRKEEIINLAKKLKSKFNTTNPFNIAKDLDINIDISERGKSIKAYTLKPEGNPFIFVNSKYTKKSQTVLCAHELGHAIMHESGGNHFCDSSSQEEYEANLFAVALLFDEEDFKIKFTAMDNYILKGLLDNNISLKSAV